MIRAGVVRVVCLTRSRSPARSGRSPNQQTVASSSVVTVGGSSAVAMRSPRDTSRSSARWTATDMPTGASSSGPSNVSIFVIVVVRPSGSTTTPSPGPQRRTVDHAGIAAAAAVVAEDPLDRQPGHRRCAASRRRPPSRRPARSPAPRAPSARRTRGRRRTARRRCHRAARTPGSPCTSARRAGWPARPSRRPPDGTPPRPSRRGPSCWRRR